MLSFFRRSALTKAVSCAAVSHLKQVLRWTVLLVIFLVGQSLSAQLSSERYDELLKLYQKGERKDLHALSISVMGMESYAERGGDTSKQLAITQAINLAATVLTTRDLSVSTKTRITTWPGYDGTEFGGKPLISRVDPESIEDPRVKSRYIKAFEEHQKFLKRVLAEREKEGAANYALEFVQRMIETSRDKETAAKTASNAIESLSAAAWIKDYERAHVFPPKEPGDPPTNAAIRVQPILQEVPVPSRTPAGSPLSSPKKTQQNPIQKPVPVSAVPQWSNANTAMLITGVIAALGFLGLLLWFLRKK